MRTGVVIAHLLMEPVQSAGDQFVCYEEAGSFTRFFCGRTLDSAVDLQNTSASLSPELQGFGGIRQTVTRVYIAPGTRTNMAIDARGTAQEVSDIIAPVLEDMGFELVDVEYVSKHGRWVLRLFIDREGGVTIDDCARVSREIGDIIDVRDIVDHEYVLEVSSPGIDRPLKKKKDFQGAAGRRVKLRTTHPREGRRNYEGVLDRVEGDTITLLVDGAEISLSIEEVEKANLVYDF